MEQPAGGIINIGEDVDFPTLTVETKRKLAQYMGESVSEEDLRRIPGARFYQAMLKFMTTEQRPQIEMSEEEKEKAEAARLRERQLYESRLMNEVEDAEILVNAGIRRIFLERVWWFISTAAFGLAICWLIIFGWAIGWIFFAVGLIAFAGTTAVNVVSFYSGEIEDRRKTLRKVERELRDFYDA